MRILAITNLYPGPGREFVAPFNRQQFAILAKTSELRVIAPVAWQIAWKQRLRAQRASGRYGNRDGILTEHPIYYYPPGMLRQFYGQCYFRSIRRVADRAIAEHRPEVLLSCWAHPDGWAAMRLGRRRRLPTVIKAVGSDLLIAARDLRRRARISEALAGADRVVTVSRHLARRAVELGAEPARVSVVPEGVDEKLFFSGSRDGARARLGISSDGAVALFAGNLLWTKGVGVLVEACRRLADRRISHHCYFVGRGADSKRLEALIHERGLERHLSLAGPCSHAELRSWYQAADVVVLPSYSEGIPNVLREALACGTPFVATDVGGISEIAHPSYSRLIPPGDSAALAAAMEAMLASPPAVDPDLVQACNVSCERSAQLLAESLQEAIDSGRCARAIRNALDRRACLSPGMSPR
jgi:glycosyltransferase involved in cell wall biosynthesis